MKTTISSVTTVLRPSFPTSLLTSPLNLRFRNHQRLKSHDPT